MFYPFYIFKYSRTLEEYFGVSKIYMPKKKLFHSRTSTLCIKNLQSPLYSVTVHFQWISKWSAYKVLIRVITIGCLFDSTCCLRITFQNVHFHPNSTNPTFVPDIIIIFLTFYFIVIIDLKINFPYIYHYY